MSGPTPVVYPEPREGIEPEWRCPACSGSGTYLQGVPLPRETLPRVRSIPCWFCNSTGDQRQMPPEWFSCPTRNDASYHETLRRK